MDSKHSTAIGLVSAIGLTIVAYFSPILFPSIPTSSQWCIEAIGIVLLLISIIALVLPKRFDRQIPELSIVIGHDGHYVTAKNYNIYNTMKTVLVGLKNTGGTYLTNCKLEFEVRNKDTNTPERWLRTLESFSLNQGEEKYIDVAAYNEPIPPHPASGIVIQLSAPPSGNFWRPPTLSKSGGVVVLIATSAESRPCEVVLRLWVEDEKLHWEKA